MPTKITPFTTSPNRSKPATFSEDMDIRLSEENSRILQMNALSDEMNELSLNMHTYASDFSNSMQNKISDFSTQMSANINTCTNEVKMATAKASEANISALKATNQASIASTQASIATQEASVIHEKMALINTLSAIKMGSFRILDGELHVNYTDTFSSPILKDGELILTC